jgi:hypothetical protein
MNSKYPRKAGHGWVNEIRSLNFKMLLVKLLGVYLTVNILFASVYYSLNILTDGTAFFDYVYFSFVTSLAIGYGDYVPLATVGKILVIMQSCVSTMYFAMMVSVLSIKMFYPGDSIRFSKKIVYDPDKDILIFRVININREALINPEVRVSVTEHNVGDNSVGVYDVVTDYKIAYLGIHDFSYSFKNTLQPLNVAVEANKAKNYNKCTQLLESRFSINISITGSYTLHQVAICKKYYAEELVVGKSFKPITYNKKGQTKEGEIRYDKIKNFWDDFESIEY